MMNDELPNVSDGSQPPLWLWRGVRLGFVMLVLSIIGLAIAAALGAADPKPVGSLKWEEKWQINNGKWQIFGQGVETGNGGLEIEVGRDEIAGAITRSESSDYTFEVAAGQERGEVGAAYGIVFGYQNPESYLAVLLNGNGYVEVASADGHEWMAWQQWPNILLGYEANRARVDVQNGDGLIRINDEVLMTVPVGEGGVGVIARGSADGQRVRFGWAKYWGK